jgi:hypothetical protein
MTIKGSCACGKTTYEIRRGAPMDIATCHCSACRRSTGGTHVTWASVPKAAFRWTGARAKLFRSSNHGRRYFCRSCGAQLAFFTTKVPLAIDVTVTTLKNPNRYPPTRHTWTDSKLAWVHLKDDLVREKTENLDRANKALLR